MSIKKLDRLKSFDKGIYFANIITRERSTSKSFINDENFQNYLQYYSKLSNRYRFAIRVEPLIKSVYNDIKILDAGCGFGTESILCGVLGARVTGLDLSKARIGIAKRRLEYYEKKLNTKLDVTFSLGNVFNLSDQYDIVWCKESISHIDPGDNFLDVSYTNLFTGGKIIISDSNILNPLVRLYAISEHRRLGGVYTTRKDPLTGDCVSYAQERFYSSNEMKRLLLKHGFEIERIYHSIFIPSIFITKNTFAIIKSIEKLFERMPVINLLSGVYTIVGNKP